MVSSRSISRAIQQVRSAWTPRRRCARFHRYPDAINAEELAEKHGVQGLALRNMLRAYPDLTPGHHWHEHYRIDAEVEARIVAHPEFQGLPKR